MSTKKYRPYFTLSELEHITQCVKSNNPLNLSLIQYLDKYILDIKSGHRQENHTLKPTISESLGFTRPESPNDSINPELLLQIYHRDSGFKSLSIREIKILQKYRYENDLMSPEEESTYLASEGVTL